MVLALRHQVAGICISHRTHPTNHCRTPAFLSNCKEQRRDQCLILVHAARCIVPSTAVTSEGRATGCRRQQAMSDVTNRRTGAEKDGHKRAAVDVHDTFFELKDEDIVQPFESVAAGMPDRGNAGKSPFADVYSAPAVPCASLTRSRWS